MSIASAHGDISLSARNDNFSWTSVEVEYLTVEQSHLSWQNELSSLLNNSNSAAWHANHNLHQGRNTMHNSFTDWLPYKFSNHTPKFQFRAIQPPALYLYSPLEREPPPISHSSILLNDTHITWCTSSTNDCSTPQYNRGVDKFVRGMLLMCKNTLPPKYNVQQYC